MSITETRVKELIGALALYWVNCTEDLGVVQRGQPSLPMCPTVYLMCRDDKVVYVGQTSRLSGRLRQHEANPQMAKLNWNRCHYFCPGIPSHHLRLVAETALIAALVPEGNKAILLKINKAQQLSEIRWRKKSKGGW